MDLLRRRDSIKWTCNNQLWIFILETAKKNGVDTSTITPYVTIMVGRIDDHLKRLREAENVDVDPELINWASIAIFKNAYAIFKDRGYKSKLLAAAFRCDLHWKEIVGGDVIISMPYDWWNQFNSDSCKYNTSCQMLHSTDV